MQTHLCYQNPLLLLLYHNSKRMEEQKVKSNRVLSIDMMRGLTLFLMLFVNDLYGPGVPQWMLHTEASVDEMGLADWVFPGFLFMVGISIPYAFQSRIQQGQSKIQIFGHILIRTFSLLIIGFFMYNSGRLNPALSGISKNTFALLMYVSIFLIWNKYPDGHPWKKLFLGLKSLGITGLIIIAVIFRAGETGNVSWMETGWWGILGLIGWGYFTAATAFLLIGPRLWATILLWLLFILLNILSQLGFLACLNFIDPVLGVIKDGNIPSIVIAGLAISLMIRNRYLPSLENRRLNFSFWDCFIGSRFYPAKLVYPIKNIWDTQLGADLQWHKHGLVCHFIPAH